MHTTHELTYCVYCSTHGGIQTRGKFVIDHWAPSPPAAPARSAPRSSPLYFLWQDLVFFFSSFSYSSFCCISLYLSLYFDWMFSMWLSKAHHLPSRARWQLQDLQAERRCSSTSIICGNPCHTHAHTHRPSCYVRLDSACTNTLPPPHVSCSSSHRGMEKANPAGWHTDRHVDRHTDR